MIAKDNFFGRYKITSEVILGKEIVASETLLSVIANIKEAMQRDDIKAFVNLLRDSRYNALSGKERQELLSTVITETGETVFELLSDISDL